MNARVKRRLTNQNIQKEQVQLVKIQKVLETLLRKVNESINVLKVEELQLRASSVTTLNSEKSNKFEALKCSTLGQEQQPQQRPAPISNNRNTTVCLLDVCTDMERKEQTDDEVNQQQIYLDMTLGMQAETGVEEEEEEF